MITQLQLLLFSGLAFFVMLPWLARTLTITLDSDWLYRRAGAAMARGGIATAAGGYARLARACNATLVALVACLYRHHGPGGLLARTWPTGSMVLWVAILLASYLLLYYL